MSAAVLAVFGFAAFMVGTPGPANLVVMVGGMRRGLGSCKGFILGLLAGKFLLNIVVGVGLGYALACQEVLLTTLKVVSVAYLTWLLMSSWNSGAGGANKDQGFRFRHGIAVHPLNPKAWVMVIIAWTQFAPALGGFAVQIVVVPLAFAGAQLIFHSSWCLAGHWLGKSIENNLLLTRILIVVTLGVVFVALLQPIGNVCVAV